MNVISAMLYLIIGLAWGGSGRACLGTVTEESVPKSDYVALVKEIWQECIKALEKDLNLDFYKILDSRLDFEHGLKQALGRSLWFQLDALSKDTKKLYKDLWQRYISMKCRKILKACATGELKNAYFYETQNYPCVEVDVTCKDGGVFPVSWIFNRGVKNSKVIDLYVAGISLMASEGENLGQQGDQGGIEAVFSYIQAYIASETP